jgi:uncharacterized protein YqfA (UPF0365 family)
MKTLDIVMLMVSSVATGMNIAIGNWIMVVITALCTTYWLVKLIKKSKEEFVVTISDEAKDYFTNNNITVVVNGKEVI